jgi:hypothetical protein
LEKRPHANIAALGTSAREGIVGQRISELSAAERAWVDDNLAAAHRYVADAGHLLDGTQPLDPPALDAAWSFWLQAWPADEEDPNPVINALGLAFGQYLVDRLGLDWKVVEDENGTEIAVHGQVGEVLVFPPNLVAKRLEQRATDFFVPVAGQIEQRVAEVRASHGRGE